MLALTFLATPADAQPGRSRWVYGDVANTCSAATGSGGTWVQLRVTRWNDLSDSVLLHRPGLTPLWSEGHLSSGRTPAQEEADGEAGYGFSVRIDGGDIETVPAFHSMIIDHDRRLGPTYRIGIRQQRLLQALRTGHILEIRRGANRLATIPLAEGRTLADRLLRCLSLPRR
jgi:hypothetical protein